MSTKYHCDGILPCFIWPDTVRHAAAEVQVLADAVNAQAQACTGLDSPTRLGWSEFYAALTAVMNEDKGSWFGLGGVMDEIARWADDLYGWQQVLASKGCTGGPPVADPNALRSGEEWTMKLAQWGVYAVIIAAGAYAVGQVISIVPKPPPPEPRRARERERARAYAP